MQTVYSPRHVRQNAEAEFIRGKRVPSFEMPRRAELIVDKVRAAGLGPVVEPHAFGLEPILRVHDSGFVHFLKGIWTHWSAENGAIDGLPNAWPAPRARRLETTRPGAEIGRYCTDMSSPITEGTWDAALAAVETALTGLDIATGPDGMAFALCRPPGHHAGADYFGGYCFLNNAAIAAQAWSDRTNAKVAVLDIDYHHGNGTQDIFYRSSDVLTVSIHADPQLEYPYYSGYADETGEASGAGFNLNLPLPWGTEFGSYQQALQLAFSRIEAFGAEALVVSLGVDTYEGDPISRFKLTSGDFSTIGAMLATLDLPTLFVMEGGYAVDDLGTNVVNVLQAFGEARQPRR